jgi:SAM-dependent methyltransferase
MSEHQHQHRTVERHCDVCIVDGSAAGLAAALELGRQRRSVIVVDADDAPGSDALREQVRGHGGEILAGRARRVGHADGGGFRAELVGGNAIVARRVLAAAALTNELPGIDAQQVLPPADSDDAADGGRIGAMLSLALAEEDLQASSWSSANQRDWDHRYDGRQMWSGNPNGTLVDEAAGLAPGRALDVGAGEGGDALWLAEHGWRVVAGDISQQALDRIKAEAERRDLPVECLRADANAHDPFAGRTFDLVSAQYASIPRTPDGRGVHHLLNAVTPGGTLLIVSHDLQPMRAPIDTTINSRAFDPDAYVRVEDFYAALTDSPDWTVELHEQRPRPTGAATSHHVDDVVLRARRSRTLP